MRSPSTMWPSDDTETAWPLADWDPCVREWAFSLLFSSLFPFFSPSLSSFLPAFFSHVLTISPSSPSAITPSHHSVSTICLYFMNEFPL